MSAGAGYSNVYDGDLLRATTWSGAIQGTISYSYDSDYRRLSEQVNGGTVIQRGYDNDGLLTSAGSLTFVRHPGNGSLSSTSIGGVQTIFSYVPGPELSAIQSTFNSDTLLSVVYQRDSVGRVVSQTEKTSGVVTNRAFTYDSGGKLIVVTRDGVNEGSYEYDSNGNRLRATTVNGTLVGTVDAQDRLVSYGLNRYEYTRNGELLRKITGPDTTTFTYDGAENLRRVSLPGGTSIDYVVDANGRRVGKRVNGTLVRGWLYDGTLSIAAELDGAGQIVSRFVYGDRPNVPEYMIRSGNTYKLITDERGSVRLVVDVSTGVIAQRIDYDAFGRITLNTNPAFQPMGFAGGLYDDQTGLVRFGARDYDAEAGRWITKDPITFQAGDPNLYAYVSDDPVNLTDVTGLSELIELVEATAEDEVVEEAELTSAKTVIEVVRTAGEALPAAAEGAPVIPPFAGTALAVAAILEAAVDIFGSETPCDREEYCWDKYWKEVGVCNALPTKRDRFLCRASAMERLNQCRQEKPEQPLWPFFAP